jgi:hypothetical protein
MVTDPVRVPAAFARAVEVGEVSEIEPGRYLTVEYIGRRTSSGRCGERAAGTLYALNMTINRN